MAIKDLISGQAFISCHKAIAKDVGLIPSAVLGEMGYLQSCYGDGFFHSQDKFIDVLCISMRQFKEAVNILKEKNYITVTRKGVPCKNFYKLNEEKILETVMKFQFNQDSVLTSQHTVDQPVSTQCANKPEHSVLAINKELIINNLNNISADAEPVGSPLVYQEEDISHNDGVDINDKSDDTEKPAPWFLPTSVQKIMNADKKTRKRTKRSEPKATEPSDNKKVREKFMAVVERLKEEGSLPVDYICSFPNAQNTNSAIKRVLDRYGLDNVLRTLDEAGSYRYAVEKMFPFNYVFSEGVFSTCYNIMMSKKPKEDAPKRIFQSKLDNMCPDCGITYLDGECFLCGRKKEQGK